MVLLPSLIYRRGNRSKEVLSQSKWGDFGFQHDFNNDFNDGFQQSCSRAHMLNHSAVLPSILDLVPSSPSGCFINLSLLLSLALRASSFPPQCKSGVRLLLHRIYIVIVCYSNVFCNYRNRYLNESFSRMYYTDAHTCVVHVIL